MEDLMPALDPLRHFIQQRFFETARWDLIVTSYALTYPGRKHLRKIGNEGDHPITEEFSDDEEDPDADINTVFQVSEPESESEYIIIASDDEAEATEDRKQEEKPSTTH